MKRAVDLAVAVIGLLVLGPLLVVLGVLVAATSPGGPFFRQVRVGRDRRPFRLVKFRSMTVRAGSEQGSFDAGDTARTTAVGRVLRRTKLDELPQLWNVLVGDMSLVGPRPEVPKWTEVHREAWDRVLTIRPGITDPASIAFRDEESILAASPDPEACYRDEILPRKLAMAEAYIRDRTLGGDLRILAMTVAALAGFGSSRPRGGSATADPGQCDR